MVIITEFLISICFCFLMGGFLFASIPTSRRPELVNPRRFLLWTSAGVGVLSFVPILSVVLDLSKSIGIWTSFYNVLFTFQNGQAWVLTFCLSALLFCLIRFNPIEQDPFLSKLSILLVVILIGSYVRSSLPETISPLVRFIPHVFFFLSFAVWGGCLLHAAWRTTSDQNWLTFLKWFAPLSTICFVIFVLTECITTFNDLLPAFHKSLSAALTNYVNGFIMNYGQALLILQLLIIPLFILTAFNGFYTRSQLLKNKTMHPRTGLRLESLVLLAIIFVTTFMGQQSPPINLRQLLHVYGPSPLFRFIYGKTVSQAFTVQLHFGMISFVLGICSLFILLIMGFGIIRKHSSMMISVLILGYLLSAYLAVNFAIQ